MRKKIVVVQIAIVLIIIPMVVSLGLIAANGLAADIQNETSGKQLTDEAKFSAINEKDYQSKLNYYQEGQQLRHVVGDEVIDTPLEIHQVRDAGQHSLSE